MKRYAPSATNRLAVARPIPLLPPVTTATFPSSFPLIVITPYLVLSNVAHRIDSSFRSSSSLSVGAGGLPRVGPAASTGARRARHHPPRLVENFAFHAAQHFTCTNH